MNINNLIKILIISSVLVALLACFSACSGEKAETPSETSSVSATDGAEESTKMVFETRQAVTTQGICGNKASWSYDAKSKTLTISGSGAITDNCFGWNGFAPHIENIRIGEEITFVCDDAFRDCVSLKEIKIPENVRDIGKNAFYGCKNLSDITVPSGIRRIGANAFFETAYYNDIENWNNGILSAGNCILKANENFSGNFTVWENIEVIAEEAFFQCDGLTGITIPETVGYINDRAFAECKNLKSVSIEGYVGLTEGVFEGSTNIENLDLGNGRFIDFFKDTKYYKNGYEEVDGIVYVGDYIINVSGNLSGICRIREGVKIIDTYLFDNTEIAEIILPSSLKTITGSDVDIDYYSFGYSLEKITVAEGNPYFRSENGVMYDKGMTTIISYPRNKKDEEFTIPDTVKRIKHAFIYSKNLKKINIGAGVEEIINGFAATSYVDSFFGCSSLEAFEVSEKNNNFSADKFGVLYNKQKTVLVYYPMANKAEEFVVPSTVVGIAECALSDALYLRHLYVGKNVERIEGEADCLPYKERRDGIERSIDIYYAGSQEEWENMVGYTADYVHFNVKNFPEVTAPPTTAKTTVPATKKDEETKASPFGWF